MFLSRADKAEKAMSETQDVGMRRARLENGYVRYRNKSRRLNKAHDRGDEFVTEYSLWN